MTTTRELREDGSLSLREPSGVALREPEDAVTSSHVFQCDIFQRLVFQQVCAPPGNHVFQCNVFQRLVFQQFGCPAVEPKPPTGGGDAGGGRVSRGARIRWRNLKKKLHELEVPSEAAKEELEKLSDALDDIEYAPLPVFIIAQTAVRAVIAVPSPSATKIARLTQPLYAALRAWEDDDEDEIEFLLLY